jgi:hypothetical protein
MAAGRLRHPVFNGWRLGGVQLLPPASAIRGEPGVALEEAITARHSASVAGRVSTGVPPRGQDRAVLIRRVLEARFGNANSYPDYILQLLQTSPKAEPSNSQMDGIVQRFARHQGDLIAHYRGIPHSLDRERTIVTSPLLRWVTYSLDDCLTILVVHEKRHFLQASRVMEVGGFPMLARKGTSEGPE